MRFALLTAAGVIASFGVNAQECITTDEEFTQRLSDFQYVENVMEFLSEKWLQILDQRIDFAADGTSYHMRVMADGQILIKPSSQRWKGTYSAGQSGAAEPMVCLRLSLDSEYENACGYLMAQAMSAEDIAVRVLVPGCGGDPNSLSEIAGAIGPRGQIFGVAFPGGADLVRTGNFVDQVNNPKPSLPSAASNQYPSISVLDLKLDINKMVGRKVAVRGKLSLFGEWAMLSDPEQEADFTQIMVGIDRLQRSQRKYILENCQMECSITINGVIGDVSFENGVIADSASW